MLRLWKKILVIFVGIVTVLYTQSVKVNAQETIREPEQLYALSACLMDADSGRVLFEKEGNVHRANASTTKIMTLILALEYGNPDDVVTVSSYAAKMPEVRLGLHAGDRYVLQDLLYSMMLESHNDSACAVA